MRYVRKAVEMDSKDSCTFNNADLGNTFTPKTIEDWMSIGFDCDFAQKMVNFAEQAAKLKCCTYEIKES
jgi:hypothetical protein